MGLRIDAVSLAEAVNRVAAELGSGRGGTVITPNVDILRQYHRSPELRETFERTDLVVADGMPVVLALRLQGTPVPERITGTDLLWALTERAGREDWGVLLAGGRPGEADRAAARLRTLHPNLRVRAHPCYVRPETQADELDLLARTAAVTSPDLIFLGLPFRTQLCAMDDLRVRLPGTWLLGVGSSFDFVNGDRVRAPGWMQRCALEWVWRLGSQPHMWRRYLVQGLPFAARLAGTAVLTRWRASPP